MIDSEYEDKIASLEARLKEKDGEIARLIKPIDAYNASKETLNELFKAKEQIPRLRKAIEPFAKAVDRFDVEFTHLQAAKQAWEETK